MSKLMVKPIGSHIENIKSKRTEEVVLPYFSPDQIFTYRNLFSFLNYKDRDILYLIFVAQKKQCEVQKILQRSQPSLCYDIKRIRKRLKFIFYLDSVFDVFLDFVENQEIFSDEEMSILTSMFYTSSFTMTHRVLNMSQVKVRYSFNKMLDKMVDLEMWEIFEIFSIIRGNLNIIRRCGRASEGTESLADCYLF